MNTWRRTGSAFARLHAEYPLFASDLKWKKAERTGGRKGKGDRTRRGEKVGEVQGGYDEHTGIKQTGNQIFYQKTSVSRTISLL